MSPRPARPPVRGAVGPVAPRGRVVLRLLAALLVTVLAATGVPAAGSDLDPVPPRSSPVPGEDAAQDPAQDPGAIEAPSLPLTVTLTSVSPSTLPAAGTGGQVAVSGLVANDGDTTYEDVNVYPVLGGEPMTSTEQLADAADRPVGVVIGSRNLDPANFAQVGDLEPGDTVRFTLRIGADDVGLSRSGVYWLGAQALGAVDGSRDAVADGRARTFVTLRGDDPGSDPRGPRAAARQVEVSLVLPVRQDVRRDDTGRLSDPAGWDARLDPDGRLGRILAVGEGPGLRPSWLLDPAVVDAAASMAAGNPGFPLTAEAAEAAAREPGAAPATGAADATDEPGPLESGATYARPGSSAARWLGDLGEVLPDEADRVNLLPYAEPDVSAIARDRRRSLLRDATAATARSTDRLGLRGQLLVAPPRGFLRPAVVVPDGPLDPSVPVLLNPRAVQDADPVPGAPLVTAGGHRVALLDRGVLAGGPSPGGDLSTLGLRQRVLAEALVTLLDAAADPRAGAGRPSLVAMPPARWDPGPDWRAADLLGGLQVPWITGSTLPGADLATTDDPVLPLTDEGTPEPPRDPALDGVLDDVLDPSLGDEPAEQVTLRYPARQARRELSVALLATAADQVELARALGSVLVASPGTGRRLERAALTATSRYVRGREARAAQRLAGQAVTALRVLRRIRLEVPSLVTMSSSTGSVTVKIVNGLDQPVQVGLDADVSSGGAPGALSLEVPDALDVPANQQVTLRLRARASRVGVNVVDLRAAAPTGRPVGLPSQVTVRASTLGVQIYRVLGAGGLVILALVVLRIRRRITVRRATHGPLLNQEPS